MGEWILILFMNFNGDQTKTPIERFDTYTKCAEAAEFYWDNRMPSDKTGLKLGCFKMAEGVKT